MLVFSTHPIPWNRQEFLQSGTILSVMSPCSPRFKSVSQFLSQFLVLTAFSSSRFPSPKVVQNKKNTLSPRVLPLSTTSCIFFCPFSNKLSEKFQELLLLFTGTYYKNLDPAITPMRHREDAANFCPWLAVKFCCKICFWGCSDHRK